MKFASLEPYVTRIAGYDADIVRLLQEAETDFIERTLCTEKTLSFDTSREDVGPGPLWDLAIDFVRELAVKWDGRTLDPVHIKADVQEFDSDHNYLTGLPEYYRIVEGDDCSQIQVIPKPSIQGVLDVAYAYYQPYPTEDLILPRLEARKIIGYAIATKLDMDGEENRSGAYWMRYKTHCRKTYRKYSGRRHRQKRIIDVNGGEAPRSGGIQARINTVTGPE